MEDSETGSSGWRYRNITLTCGRGCFRWWWQMCTPTGSRWTSNNYITRCHRRLESVPVPIAVGVSWGQDASVSSPARTRKKSDYGQKNFGSICSSLTPSPTHLSHTRNITLSRIKCGRYIFIKKCICSFIGVRILCLSMFPHVYVYVYVYS